MPKPYTLLRKEMTRIKGLQEEINNLLKKDWFSESFLLQALQPLLLMNTRSQEAYSQENCASFSKKVLEIINNKDKKSNLIMKAECGFLILGFSLLLGRRIIAAVDKNMGLELIQEVESFHSMTSKLGVVLIFISLVLESLFQSITKIKIEKTTQEREESQYKISKILALLKELERACENLSFYRDLCADPSLLSSVDIRKMLEEHPMRYIPLECYEAIQSKHTMNPFKKESDLKPENKNSVLSSTPPQLNEDKFYNPPQNKLNYTKWEKISEKIAEITRYLPPSTVSSYSKKSTCLMIKMSVQELEEKLSGLKKATITKSHNEASLLIRFSDSIEIRIIGETGKKNKKIIEEKAFKKTTSPTSKTKNDLSDSDQKKPEKKNTGSKKTIAITSEDTSPSSSDFISDETTHVVIQAIQEKLKKLTGKPYNFLNKTYGLIRLFIKLAYIFKTHFPELTVLAFGGIWRSLLMGEEPKDVDIAIVISPEFDPEKELFKPLKQSKLIDDYRKSAKPEITLYTVSFLNTIYEMTIFKHKSIDANARTLDFTCNVFALEIIRFDLPMVTFHMPLTSERFLLEVKQGIPPTIDAVINPNYLTILKNTKMKTRVIAMIGSVFPDWTPRLIQPVMDRLIKSPDNFSTVQPTRLVFFILKLLNFMDDPKRIMRLLNLYQSNHYQLHTDLQVILYLIPSLFNAVATQLEEKLIYPSLSRTHLLHYFREYMIKSNGRQITQPPLLSDLNLLKVVLLAGINPNIQQKTKVDTLFREATIIYRVRQICRCLSRQPKSLSKYEQKTAMIGCFSQSKQKTAIIDCLLVAMVLAKTHEFFPTISTTHPDPTTLFRCYLLPPFKAELKKVADLFHYIIDYTSIDQEQLSNLLLYKWYQYSYPSHHFIEPILPETTTHRHGQNPRKLSDKKEEDRVAPAKNILLSMMTTFTTRGHAMLSSPISSSQEDVIKTQQALLAPQARLFHPVTPYEPSPSDTPKKLNKEKSDRLPEKHLENIKKL